MQREIYEEHKKSLIFLTQFFFIELYYVHN